VGPFEPPGPGFCGSLALVSGNIEDGVLLLSEPLHPQNAAKRIHKKANNTAFDLLLIMGPPCRAAVVILCAVLRHFLGASLFNLSMHVRTYLKEARLRKNAPLVCVVVKSTHPGCVVLFNRRSRVIALARRQIHRVSGDEMVHEIRRVGSVLKASHHVAHLMRLQQHVHRNPTFECSSFWISRWHR
jgi:hypothetical protein